MGRFVMKAAPDRDLYVEWSTVVDNATFIGSRSQMREYLLRDIPSGYAPLPGNSPEDRLARADSAGTSALWPSPSFEGAWGEDLMVEQRGMLPRGDLARFAEALVAGDEGAAYALVVPFGDDE